MDAADFERLSGDTRVNDLSLWLKPERPSSVEPGAAKQQQVRVEQALRELAREQARESAPSGSNTPMAQADALLEFGSTQSIRAISLRIFDRSFAVTYWLQAVAIGIGLFGVAASFSAQVLARRKEFGLLVHLGLTRQQVLKVVALEGLAWTSLGTLAGIALGLAVALVLVHVVNPQSFHWTMNLSVPWLRLIALGVAVITAGTLTVWLSGRAAAGQDAVLAVKEDW
jgi:putative ABC transport system permease protein